MKYQIIDLGKHYPGKIHDFSEARNLFLEKLKDGEWILYKDSDVEASQMLLEYLDKLVPEYPWYDIRQFNYINGKYQPLQNPFYTGVLASNRVRWRGRVHEKLYPRNPHGVIELPLIHNHKGPSLYENSSPPRPLMIAKKLWEIGRYGYR